MVPIPTRITCWTLVRSISKALTIVARTKVASVSANCAPLHPRTNSGQRLQDLSAALELQLIAG